MLKYFSLATLLFCVVHTSFAQERIGLRMERYAGINSVMMNPANNITYPLKWDLNIAAAGVFVDNTYAYFRNTNLIRLARNAENIEVASALDTDTPTDGLTILDFYNDRNKHYGKIDVLVTGPSFLFKTEAGHSFGFFTNARVSGGSEDIPWQLNYYYFDETPFDDPIFVPSFTANVMSWTELGFNYAYQVPTATGNLGFGINLKVLNGYEALWLRSRDNITIRQYANDSVTVENINADLMLTTSNKNNTSYDREVNGRGVGIDLGVVLTIDEDEDHYRWKLGASLMDIGFIRFNQAETYRFINGGLTSFSAGDYETIETEADFLDQINEDILSGGSGLTGTKFNMWLPTGLNLQADYGVTEMIYIGALFQQRLPLAKVSTLRGNVLAISPRIDHRWFSAQIPVSIYNWQKMQVGLSARLGFLTIGSDNLGSILGSSNLDGMDFYLALRFNPFRIGSGSGRSRGKNGAGCYDF